jgi:putative methyltransferase (TIGR04325 family)
MDINTANRSALGRAESVPFVRRILQARYERRFRDHVSLMENLYRGVYSSFSDASESIPATRPVGYDNSASAELYRDRVRRIFLYDYPMMFWLSRIFAAGNTSVFDLGGHIGIAYYAYQRCIDYPDAIRWQVSDVPKVNAAGVTWAEAHDSRHRLTFTANPADADGADILFAAGSLQYLDYTLADLLGSLESPPTHLLLNSVPIHMSTSYFTVQNMGATCCPYRITSEREFIDGLKALDYRLRDRWENPDRRCLIPFHPAHSLDRYFGFYFSRDA